MAECPHLFSDPAYCDICTPRSKPEPAAPIHATAIEAKFDGRCAECRDPIEKGDLIVADLRGGWSHDECG